MHELEQLGEDGLQRADVGELHVPLRPAGGEVRQPRLEVEDHLRDGGGRVQLCDIIIAAGGEVRQPRLEVEDHLRDGDIINIIINNNIIIAAGGEVRQPRLEVEDHLRDGDLKILCPLSSL